MSLQTPPAAYSYALPSPPPFDNMGDPNKHHQFASHNHNRQQNHHQQQGDFYPFAAATGNPPAATQDLSHGGASIQSQPHLQTPSSLQSYQQVSSSAYTHTASPVLNTAIFPPQYYPPHYMSQQAPQQQQTTSSQLPPHLPSQNFVYDAYSQQNIQYYQAQQSLSSSSATVASTAHEMARPANSSNSFSMPPPLISPSMSISSSNSSIKSTVSATSPDLNSKPTSPPSSSPISSSSPPSSSSSSSSSKNTIYFTVVPGTHQHKRPRRRYEEIERLYKCSFEDCTKAYGTLNHLNAHVTMQKHGPKRTPDEFKETRRLHKLKKKEEEEARKKNAMPVAGLTSTGQISSNPQLSHNIQSDSHQLHHHHHHHPHHHQQQLTQPIIPQNIPSQAITSSLLPPPPPPPQIKQEDFQEYSAMPASAYNYSQHHQPIPPQQQQAYIYPTAPVAVIPAAATYPINATTTTTSSYAPAGPAAYLPTPMYGTSSMHQAGPSMDDLHNK